MILGIVSAILFLLVISKFITKRLPFRRLDVIALKVHRQVGVLLLVVSVIHLVTVWNLLHQRPFAMFLFGILLVISIAGAIISRLLVRKVGKRWIVFHRAFTVIAGLCLIVHVWIGISGFTSYQNAIADMSVKDINLSQVADGTYEGQYDAGYIYAKVSVTVKQGEIRNITILEHRNEKGAAAETIIADMIKRQTVDVDVVSGATNSSKVIKKAVENAIRKGLS